MSEPGGVTGLIRELVRIPSVNPAGNPGTDGVGEAACAEHVAAFLRNCDADVQIDEVEPGRPNVLARFPANRAGKKRLLFAPHLDTVSVAGMTIDPFGAELREGRIYGRGASDTKGSMAAMLWALHEMRERLPDLDHEIWFAGLMGEEAGQQGARSLVRKFTADFAVVGEPTNLDIVHTHKGCLWLVLTAHGKAVHAATPGRGENAIYKICDVIDFIRRDLAAELATIPDPVLGSPTVSVGTCRGGSKTNIVPDNSTIEVDIRTVPALIEPGWIENLRAKLRHVCAGLDMQTWEARPLYTDPSHPLIGALQAAGGQCVGAPWFCDAAVLAEAGIPSVAVGPGSIAQAHTEDEWIEVAELERGVHFFRAFLDRC